MKNKNLSIIILVLVLVLVLISIIFIKTRRQTTIIKNKSNMTITSPVFTQNNFIPSKYTCDGENINPPLNITNIPEKAKSLVLIVDDPDAPGGTFIHWIVFNINPGIHTIEENSIPNKGKEGINSFHKINYGGPCPPSGIHHYFFRLYALDTRLDLSEGANIEDVNQKIQNHILAQATLMGLYKKK